MHLLGRWLDSQCTSKNQHTQDITSNAHGLGGPEVGPTFHYSLGDIQNIYSVGHQLSIDSGLS
jgi:hypothetical protein